MATTPGKVSVRPCAESVLAIVSDGIHGSRGSPHGVGVQPRWNDQGAPAVVSSRDPATVPDPTCRIAPSATIGALTCEHDEPDPT